MSGGGAHGRAGPTGLVVVDKPGAMTSHDVVARARRALGTRKVGHAGTLDPMATGVLVLGVGRATRLLGHLLATEKTYVATARLGVSTTTDDAEGEVTGATPAGQLAEHDIRSALARFVGDIEQVPTDVSAIKVDGRRAYERVRAGEEVELPARPVTVHEIEVHDVRSVADFTDVDFSVRCSSGTYVRALARDLGAALGVGGHLIALRRTAVGAFGLDVAVTLEDLAERGKEALVPIAAAARDTFDSRDLDDALAADVRFGRQLRIDLPDGIPVAVFAPDGEFLALYERKSQGVAAAVAVFV
ncbi:tRNA pseudouridine(55) synthase TruB [Nocardioides bigeumensis]|uniref:tRNA pseudouridine synthase B n=1 Tax=Nocardioides bigeumensis TaxID=433657 RepID=A0ABN2XUS4_9ACTN